MINIFKFFEDSMIAAAFAEAGEHGLAKEYLPKAKTAHKKILLGTSAAELTPKALSHAISVCKRIGASLEILHVLPGKGGEKSPADARTPSTMAKLARLQERFKTFGILYEFVTGNNTLEEEIIRYAANRRDIMLILLGNTAEKSRRQDGNTLDALLLQRFQCPVVLLEQPQSA